MSRNGQNQNQGQWRPLCENVIPNQVQQLLPPGMKVNWTEFFTKDVKGIGVPVCQVEIYDPQTRKRHVESFEFAPNPAYDGADDTRRFTWQRSAKSYGKPPEPTPIQIGVIRKFARTVSEMIEKGENPHNPEISLEGLDISQISAVRFTTVRENPKDRPIQSVEVSFNNGLTACADFIENEDYDGEKDTRKRVWAVVEMIEAEVEKEGAA